MTIQLVDRSFKVRKEMLEDILLKVKDFIFHVDFILLDMEGVDFENQTSISLGRPFLAIVTACINYRTRIMDILFGNKMIRLNVFNATISPVGDKCISFAEEEKALEEATMEVIASICKCSTPYNEDLTMTEPNHRTMYNNVVHLFVNLGERVELDVCIVTQHSYIVPSRFELLPLLMTKPDSSTFDSPTIVELKPLPHTLKYMCLGEKESHVIISF